MLLRMYRSALSQLCLLWLGQIMSHHLRNWCRMFSCISNHTLCDRSLWTVCNHPGAPAHDRQTHRMIISVSQRWWAVRQILVRTGRACSGACIHDERACTSAMLVTSYVTRRNRKYRHSLPILQWQAQERRRQRKQVARLGLHHHYSGCVHLEKHVHGAGSELRTHVQEDGRFPGRLLWPPRLCLVVHLAPHFTKHQAGWPATGVSDKIGSAIITKHTHLYFRSIYHAERHPSTM
eukprot:COSAG01_NODE_12720_length_1694_cov_1.310972_1_plen_235_part_00